MEGAAPGLGTAHITAARALNAIESLALMLALPDSIN